jgi:hypothetical protein
VDALAAGDALAELGLADDDPAGDGPAPWEQDTGAEDQDDQDADPLRLFGNDAGAAG